MLKMPGTCIKTAGALLQSRVPPPNSPCPLHTHPNSATPAQSCVPPKLHGAPAPKPRATQPRASSKAVFHLSKLRGPPAPEPRATHPARRVPFSSEERTPTVPVCLGKNSKSSSKILVHYNLLGSSSFALQKQKGSYYHGSCTLIHRPAFLGLTGSLFLPRRLQPPRLLALHFPCFCCFLWLATFLGSFLVLSSTRGSPRAASPVIHASLFL